MKKGKLYKRFEDMSGDGHLVLYMNDNGNTAIETFGYPGNTSTKPVNVHLEFTTNGQSPNTRRALMALADAMEKDNIENSIHKRTPS